LIKAGKRATVTLDVPVSELGLYNDKMQYVVEPGEFEIQVGSASDNICFTKNDYCKVIKKAHVIDYSCSLRGSRRGP
jgi:hypothetical protein